MKTKFILAVLAITFISIGVNAQSVRDRERNQNARIERGLHNGTLTHREARHLKKEQHRIHHKMRMAKRHHGRRAVAERRHVRHMQDRAGHNIYRDEHRPHNSK